MNEETFWRSLDELADHTSFNEGVHDEFRPGVTSREGFVSRREFLTLLSASTLAGLSGCAPSVPEKIVPYVRQPEEIVPGKPLLFATAMPMPWGDALGILAESHMGRPTKIEGNPDHPTSLGSTDAWAQASILTLYDPDRSQVITNAGRISTWDAFSTALANELEAKRLNGGAGFRILTEKVTSPTIVRQLAEILSIFPQARWHQHEPAAGYADADYHFEQADVILSLDADFLLRMPGHVRYAREFALRRRGNMNRLYVIESTPTITGAMADHRRAVRSSEIRQLLSSNDAWVATAMRDLEAHRGRSLVVAGEGQPMEVHALARQLNTSLGNVGQTVTYRDAETSETLGELVRDMQGGIVDVLLMLGGNPVYTAPADFEFAKQLNNVRLRVHLSLYDDETSERCHWHIPDTHYLETWGDIRSNDGTTTIMQPLINPLYAGKSATQVLAAVLGNPTQSTHDLVRASWKVDDETWRQGLHDGVSRWQLDSTLTRRDSLPAVAPPSPNGRGVGPDQLEIVFRPDPTIFDGRFANNAWLQELPKPITKLVWDNPALISPATAQKLGVENGDVVEITTEGRKLQAPVWISPGHADNSITLYLGYGRTRAGKAGSNIGYNAYSVRTSSSPWIGAATEIRKTGARRQLVCTQAHQLMENRGLIRYAAAAKYSQQPNFFKDEGEAEIDSGKTSLYPENDRAGDYAWGMAIDLSTCIGCNACVIACQAENNIPTVGKDECAREREMHWLRIDRYFEGEANQPNTFFQPVLCMHCEKAPCEPVCPVAATTHSDEGLNEMTYNRCVGTRYCSNNCPYKVRRFNFLEYSLKEVPSLKLLYNPDVTVRSRGVMEKCTYCVQRINHGRIDAKKEDRVIRDGEVMTACQAACPADAIVFGNLNDPESRVSKMKGEPRNYGLLTHLNTQPRTTYSAKLTNPNPQMG
jgi:MoCo/4Fe-4S cofactor protein with predicted Tat translocation signal